MPFWVKHPRPPDFTVCGMPAAASFQLATMAATRLLRRRPFVPQGGALDFYGVKIALSATCDWAEHPSFGEHSADYVCEPTDPYMTTE